VAHHRRLLAHPLLLSHRPPDIATMATVLRDAGYSTLWIGKNHDWLPTFMAMAGDPDIPQKLLTGYEADGRTFKVDIDGYNLLPYLTGEVDESPRKGFIYFNDDGDCVGVRYGNFKIVFMEQRCPGTLQVWAEPFTPLRVPKVFNLRTDPFERADITSNSYWQWMFYHGPNTQAGVAIVQAFTETFKDFPPRQKAASFTLEQANDAMMSAGQG
jgi:arylsulfatase A-like enzyme